jgi:hypothetical protein
MTQTEIRDTLRRLVSRRKFAARSGIAWSTLHRLCTRDEKYTATAGTLAVVSAALRKYRPKLKEKA